MIRIIVKYVVLLIVVGCLLFIPAGSLKFTGGLLFIGLLFIPMLITGIILKLKNPVLLEKRVNDKDSQKVENRNTINQFIGCFILAGLNYRFNWFNFPKVMIVLASIVFVGGYLMFLETLRENPFLSRSVELQKDQEVISTGLYGVVRHPMYLAYLLMLIAMPIILNCPFSYFMLVPIPLLLIERIKAEELLLEEGLFGYKEYKQKVKYRLIPYIW